MQINSAKELTVYKIAYQLAMDIFELTKTFPPEEIRADSADSPIIAIGLFESSRSVGETSIRSTLHE